MKHAQWTPHAVRPKQCSQKDDNPPRLDNPFTPHTDGHIGHDFGDMWSTVQFKEPSEFSILDNTPPSLPTFPPSLPPTNRPPETPRLIPNTSPCLLYVAELHFLRVRLLLESSIFVTIWWHLHWLNFNYLAH